MERPQRGQVAWPCTGRPGSAAVQAPHRLQLPASRPGTMATGAPQEAQPTSGASTKRTRWPHDGHAPRSPVTRMAAPQLGHGVVGAGTPGHPRRRP